MKNYEINYEKYVKALHNGNYDHICNLIEAGCPELYSQCYSCERCHIDFYDVAMREVTKEEEKKFFEETGIIEYLDMQKNNYFKTFEDFLSLFKKTEDHDVLKRKFREKYKIPEEMTINQWFRESE